MREDGTLAGVAASGPFLDRVLDRPTGRLDLERRGRIWESVSVACRRGDTGAGRLVAVVDGGFDLTVPTLGERVHPSSVIRADTVVPANGHGTAVALLVREVAPDCELLLLDVAGSGAPQRADVASAITVATQAGADVINLSLQFETDCPVRDTSWIDLDLLGSPAPPAAAYAAQVDAWVSHAEPYAGPRCVARCEVCDALSGVPESTLVVAASGNWTVDSCPACFERVVGVGFHRTRRAQSGGSVFTVSELSVSEAPVGRAELLIEEPPGFVGTSFAAPLLSGLGALAPAPADLATMSRISRAMTPVLTLAGLQVAHAPDLPADAPWTLHQGLVRIAEAIPSGHRHLDQDRVDQPCVVCTLLLADWYDVFVSLLVASGNPDGGLAIARVAALLAPEVASVSGNYGLASERAAQSRTDAAARAALLDEARAAYRNAIRLAPDVQMYADGMRRLG